MALDAEGRLVETIGAAEGDAEGVEPIPDPAGRMWRDLVSHQAQQVVRKGADDLRRAGQELVFHIEDCSISTEDGLERERTRRHGVLSTGQTKDRPIDDGGSGDEGIQSGRWLAGEARHVQGPRNAGVRIPLLTSNSRKGTETVQRCNGATGTVECKKEEEKAGSAGG